MNREMANTKAKKIAIVTNYKNLSYGSALQAYAMQSVIKELGYDCENLQYNPRVAVPDSSSRLVRVLRNPSLIMNKLKRVKNSEDERLSVFSTFVDENISSNATIYRSNDELKATNELYEAFVCGSDQIWAPNQFDEWYYLSFVAQNFKKIAYAPSIGLPKIPDELKGKISDLVKKIGHLSIREQEGADLVRELTGIDIPVVLDPTFLLDASKWRMFAEPRKIRHPYILCYFLGENPNHRQLADKIGRERGLKRVVLPFTKSDYRWGDILLKSASPKEFIDLVDNAEMVLTDSFHGMAFSINLNTQFYSLMRFNDDHPVCQNSRIRNILSMFELQDNLLNDDCNIEKVAEINFDRVNELIMTNRERSLIFLKEALDQAVKGKVNNA